MGRPGSDSCPHGASGVFSFAFVPVILLAAAATFQKRGFVFGFVLALYASAAYATSAPTKMTTPMMFWAFCEGKGWHRSSQSPAVGWAAVVGAP